MSEIPKFKYQKLVFPSIVIAFLTILYLVVSTPTPEIRGTTVKSTPLPTPTPKATTIAKPAPKVPQIDCRGPDGVTFKTSETECIKFRTDWGLSPSATPYPTPHSQTQGTQPTTTYQSNTYTAQSYPPCTVYYPYLDYSTTYDFMTAEECVSFKASVVNSTAPITTPTPTQAIDYSALNSQCKDSAVTEYNSTIASINVNYGSGSGAGQAMYEIAQIEYTSAVDTCNTNFPVN